MANGVYPLFDSAWYLKRYPDVKYSKLDPLYHYFCYGEHLGRKPSTEFDPAYYLECYPDVIELGVSPLKHYVSVGKKEGRRGHAKTIKEYVQQLWRREHIADCLAALISFTESNKSDQVRLAAWELARWFAWQEDWHYCAFWLRLYYQQPAPKVPWPIIQLLYCESLLRIGEQAEAEQQAVALKNQFPGYFDANLAFSNLHLSQLEALPRSTAFTKTASALNNQRIDVINALFSSNSLSLIDIELNSKTLSLDTITPAAYKVNEAKSHEADVVSVIVPVFNAERFLATALRSLASQSYGDIEILIVDDASTDSSRSVAEQFVSQDARFKLLCLPHNQGAYSARNFGLKHAKGVYITVHDADDWSHPGKIVSQVNAFDANPEWVANTSDMVRCTTDMRFGRWRLPNTSTGGWIYRNTSSLMFKREVFEALGFWDRVRCAGDTEYFHRIIAAFGKESLGEVLKGLPLSFCRHQDDSLSQSGHLHLITNEKGVRRDYLRAARAWHAKANNPSDLFMPDNPSMRPFLSPVKNMIS